MSHTLRPLLPADGALLRDATLGNMNWCGERFTMDDVMSRPEFAHYTELVPDRGDFGVVAESEAGPVGACWALFLSADDPGYGFIDDGTPEASVWVAPAARAGGLGRSLLEALIAEARERGLGQIGLSVEPDNHAKRLYSSLGFEDVAGRSDDGVILLRL